MVLMKSYSRKSFVYILLAGLVLFSATVAGAYYGLLLIDTELSQPAAAEISAGQQAGKQILLSKQYLGYGAAGVASLFVLLGLILWLALRRTARSLLQDTGPRQPSAGTKAATSAAQRQAAQRQQQRLFLHLLCVLQREGRLVDFLSEDLDQYDDTQIGTAVRGIHENCKKSIQKNLKLQPVIDQPEGETTQVDPGFNSQAVKLTGNVTGEPPFKGILRHRGWRTTQLELPTLSDVQDSSIIAPAEVEII